MKCIRRILLFLNLAACLSGLTQGTTEDTLFVNDLLQKSKTLTNEDPTKAISVAEHALAVAKKIHFQKGEAYALKNIGLVYYVQGKYIETLNYWNESLQIFEKQNDPVGISNILNNIGAIYMNQGEDAKALEYCLKSLKIAEKTGDNLRIMSALANIGGIYYNKKDPAALTYFLKALPLSEGLDNKDDFVTIAGNIGEIYFDAGDQAKALMYFQKAINTNKTLAASAFAYNGIGKIYLQEENFALALKNHFKALEISERADDNLEKIRALRGIANVHAKQGGYHAALDFYKKARTIGEQIHANLELKNLYEEMASAYSIISDYPNAFLYKSLYADMKDTLYNIETAKKLGKLQFDFDLYKKQGEIDLLTKNKEVQELNLRKERFTKNSIVVAFVLIIFIAIIIFRNYRIKAKTNSILDRQNREINEAYKELKSTQAQLIQSEKMASLGELTAGIAHEIQNPLNFVNNFSEVSKELMDEMKTELDKGNAADAKGIANDVIKNLEKIHHHGKRADAIVKNMLQHSQTSAGQKEPTDINKFAAEYLRLAYHGLRAKDKSINVTIRTDLDDSVGKLDIIPQDIGKVLLNLYNNAFYAVAEKKKILGESYEPVVSVSTKKLDGKSDSYQVEIRVNDNGNGIPQKVVDKIFQPFFTTKPTGQGTGLGLSLSYDIITKEHGGTIKLETQEGEGAGFIIQLPSSDKMFG